MKIRITKERQSKNYLEALKRNYKFPEDRPLKLKRP